MSRRGWRLIDSSCGWIWNRRISMGGIQPIVWDFRRTINTTRTSEMGHWLEETGELPKDELLGDGMKS